jgi:hypothetical protein
LPARRSNDSASADAKDPATAPVPIEISRVEIEYDKFNDEETAGEVKSSGKATPVNGSSYAVGH